MARSLSWMSTPLTRATTGPVPALPEEDEPDCCPQATSSVTIATAASIGRRRENCEALQSPEVRDFNEFIAKSLDLLRPRRPPKLAGQSRNRFPFAMAAWGQEARGGVKNLQFGAN